MKINCVITDDEPIAQDIIEDYVHMMPELVLCAKCSDALETFQVLQQKKIDLLFLDIQLPGGISGVSFLKTLKSPPLIIFTTAYPDYALEGFDLDVVDYLLKPVSQERFMKAIAKVHEKLSGPTRVMNTTAAVVFEKDYLFVRHNRQLVKLSFEDILYFESVKDYVKVVLIDKSILTLTTLKQIESGLPGSLFLRVHNSFIINESKIDAIEGNIIVMGRNTIPISRRFKNAVMNRLTGQ